MTRTSRQEYLISIALGHGARLGLIAGLLAAIIYVLGLTFIVFSMTVAVGPPSNGTWMHAVVGALVVAVLALVTGFALGVLPALLVGFLTGILIAFLLQRNLAWLSQRWAVVVGGSVCTLVSVLLLYIVLHRADTGLLVIVGLPMLIYIAVGGVLSRYCYTALVQDPRAVLPDQRHATEPPRDTF